LSRPFNFPKACSCDEVTTIDNGSWICIYACTWGESKATNLGKKNVFFGGKFCIILGATFIFNLMF
jgi:hypothetical protein